MDISNNQLTRLPTFFNDFVKNSFFHHRTKNARLGLGEIRTISPCTIRLSQNFITGAMCQGSWTNVDCPIVDSHYFLFPQLCRAGYIRFGEAYDNAGVGGTFGECVPVPVPSFQVRQVKMELVISATKTAKNVSSAAFLVVSAVNATSAGGIGGQWLENGLGLPALTMRCGPAPSCVANCRSALLFFL